jgi:hypothetical protein
MANYKNHSALSELEREIEIEMDEELEGDEELDQELQDSETARGDDETGDSFELDQEAGD